MTNEFSFTLGPSPIDGVGVFATHAIEENAELRMFAPDDISWRSEFLPPTFYKHVVVELSSTMCPQDFGRMSVGWYLNHSDDPNAAHKDYRYFALRDIEPGEEVTINYTVSL